MPQSGGSDPRTGQNPQDLGEAVRLTREGQYLQALDLFEEALGQVPQAPTGVPAWHRVLSHYGVCLAMVWGHTDRARAYCVQAIEVCAPSSDLYVNLGLVLLRGRRRAEALDSIRAALALEPTNQRVQRTLERLSSRRRLLFPFLERKHPLNKFSGILIARMQRLWEPQRHPLDF